MAGRRAALGADARAVLLMILRQAMTLAIVGTVAWAASAAAINVAVRVEMHDARGLDAIAFSGSIAVLVAALLLASVIPARRAATVDPLVVLRQE